VRSWCGRHLNLSVSDRSPPSSMHPDAGDGIRKECLVKRPVITLVHIRIPVAVLPKLALEAGFLVVGRAGCPSPAATPASPARAANRRRSASRSDRESSGGRSPTDRGRRGDRIQAASAHVRVVEAHDRSVAVDASRAASGVALDRGSLELWAMRDRQEVLVETLGAAQSRLRRWRRISQAAVGTCCVMQWMFPPPSRISRAEMPTSWCSGKHRPSTAAACSS
jgi:hypothetical protein